MSDVQERSARIRELNDTFRKTFTGGKLVMSASVSALPEKVKGSALVSARGVRRFHTGKRPARRARFLQLRALQPHLLLEVRLLRQRDGWRV